MGETIVVLASMLGFSVEQLGSVRLKGVTHKFYNYSESKIDILGKYFKSEITLYNLAAQRFEKRKC